MITTSRGRREERCELHEKLAEDVGAKDVFIAVRFVCILQQLLVPQPAACLQFRLR